MSLAEGSKDTEIFLDTSVLLNYVLDQGDEGAFILITSSDKEIVISESVSEEFERVPDRREEVYLDLMQVIISDDENVEDIIVSDRDYLEGSDASYFRSLKTELSEKDPARQLKQLREHQKIIDRRFGQTREIISRVLDKNGDEILISKIARGIGSQSDGKVICDAVMWSGQGGNGDFATLDGRHMLSKETHINQIIKDHHGRSHTLNISKPIQYIDE